MQSESADVQLKIIESALTMMGGLDLYESLIGEVDFATPIAERDHPPARDRFVNILHAYSHVKGIDASYWGKFLETNDYWKSILIDDFHENPNRYDFYGSVYLGAPNTEWRGPELRDRVDYY